MHACTTACEHTYTYTIKRFSWLQYLSQNFGTTFFPSNLHLKVLIHKICKYNILSSNLTTQLRTNDCTTIRNSAIFSLSLQFITTTLTLLSYPHVSHTLKSMFTAATALA